MRSDEVVGCIFRDLVVYVPALALIQVLDSTLGCTLRSVDFDTGYRSHPFIDRNGCS